MREKIKGNMKKILPIMMCFMLIFGSCISVHAAKISTNNLSMGTEVLENIVVRSTDNPLISWRYYNKYSLVSSSSEVKYMPFETFKSNGGSYGVSLVFVSKAHFQLHVEQQKFYDGKGNIPEVNSNPFSSSSGETNPLQYVDHNGSRYYFFILSWGGDGYQLEESNISYINVSNYVAGDWYDIRGQVFEMMFDDTVKWDDGHGGGGGSFAPDIENGSSNYNLGYLSNVRTRSLNVDNSSSFYKQVLWDNNHSDWDDSYRVAHYVKFKGYIVDYFGNTREYDSDLTFIQNIPFTSCKSTYDMFGGVYKETNQAFRDFLQSEMNMSDDKFVIQAHDYLIIFHETENGTQFGYWNIIRSADINDKYDEFIYGTTDGNGNFSEVGNTGQVENSVGKGDSVEDAENNSQVIAPPIDNAPEIDSIGDFMEYFVDMMESLFKSIGALPKYLAEFFSFLPNGIITTISLGLLIAIILRIVGR